jgi:hypothetical protein
LALLARRPGRADADRLHYLTNNADAAICHARLDGGLAMVFAYQAAEELRQGRLKTVLRDFELRCTA